MEGVHKRLRQISTHLMLIDIPFFGVNASGARAASGPFEPPGRLENLALLVEGEGGGEPTEGKRSFGMRQRKVAMSKPIGVSILGQLVEHGMEGGRASRVVSGDRSSERRKQESSIDGGVIGRPLPVAVGVGGHGWQ